MSTQSTPIDPLRFAEALEALPLDALHAKAAELQNSIGHLRSSNDQMLPFADEGDQDCKEAMFENLGVIGRMNERVGLIKAEVERRGMPWPSEERQAESGVGSEAGEAIVAGRGEMVNGDGEMVNGTVGSAPEPASTGARQQQSGRLTDEELRRQVEAQLEAQMAEEDDGGEGVHL